jgi:hypothetical protein
MPSRSKPPAKTTATDTTATDTVVIGSRSMESLIAEFGDLVERIGDNPPKGAATIRQLAQVWNLSIGQTKERVRRMVKDGRLEPVGKFRVVIDNKGPFSIPHYVRARPCA